jgi:hypothetical protein
VNGATSYQPQLREVLMPLGMSDHALSQAIRVPATRVNDIVNGKCGVTAGATLRRHSRHSVHLLRRKHEGGEENRLGDEQSDRTSADLLHFQQRCLESDRGYRDHEAGA